MSGSFGQRLDVLRGQVGGPGPLEGGVVVDQVYAKYQHERLDLNHPRGGEAGYLRNGLFATMEENMTHLAEVAITEEGSNLRGGMKDAVENVAEQVYERSPREWDDLRLSAHPTVTDDGAVIYDRAPLVPRLTDEELDRKKRLAGHLGGNITQEHRNELRAARTARRAAGIE